MKKAFSHALAFLVVLSVLCCSLVFASNAQKTPSTQVITLTKTNHSSSIDQGTIDFADGVYSFNNSNDILSTGLITGKSHKNFIWEFLWYADDVSWGLDNIMFYCTVDGILEDNAYSLRIEGINHGNGIKLYKNGDFSNALAEYRLSGHMKTWKWDNVKYKVKLEAKDGVLKVWFNESTANAGDPVITYALDDQGPQSGDFKIQGYSTRMKLEDMSIKTDSENYYFDSADMPKDGTSKGSTENPSTGVTENNGVIVFVVASLALSILTIYNRKRVIG